MVTEADWKNWKEEDFTAYLDIIFDAFGTKRVMIGSDWPSTHCFPFFPSSDDAVRRIRASARHCEALHREILPGGARHDSGRQCGPLLPASLPLCYLTCIAATLLFDLHRFHSAVCSKQQCHQKRFITCNPRRPSSTRHFHSPRPLAPSSCPSCHYPSHSPHTPTISASSAPRRRPRSPPAA